MTAKEKAIELLEKFKKATTYKYQEYAGANYSIFEHDIEELKQCAIIAVDEIIDHCGQVEPWLGVDFWQEVKNELENFNI